MAVEEWRYIYGFPRYQISNLGRIRGCKTSIMRPENNFGYKRVTLQDRKARRRVLVHRLVLEHFLGPCPEGKEVNHKDGNRSNNCLENLEYVTRSENQHHAYQVLGKGHQSGSLHGMSILKEADVLAIRARAGEPQKNIAADFGIGIPTVSMILARKTWRHI